MWQKHIHCEESDHIPERYRGFGGGGFGFGTPVVSYAPRPMLIYESSLVIMEAACSLSRVQVSVLGSWEVGRDGRGLIFWKRELLYL